MKRILIAIMTLPLAMACVHNGPCDDYNAISNLIVGERMYRAGGRSEQHRGCFWDDATIRTSWQKGGVDTFVGQSPVEMRHDLLSVNRSASPLIHQEGDRAFVEYPSTTVRSVMLGENEAILTSYMRLLYKVEKREGEWRIRELATLFEGDQISPAIPGTDLHIDTHFAMSLRQSYRWLAYSRISAGGTESDDLPGTDRPQDVKMLYDEFNSYLYGIDTEDIEVLSPESGKIVRGTLYKPSGNGKMPLIVCSHELGSDGMRPWWVNYANRWAREGYAVVTFDFCGGGERSRSDGKTTDMSVLTEVSDLEAVMTEVRGWDFVDGKNIILAGGSQGGGVATIVAARHPEWVSAMVLLYPAFYLPEDLHRRYPDLKDLPESDDRGMITIGKRYILDMYDYDYRADMRSVKCPVLLVHGNKDRVVSLGGSEEAVGIFKDARLHVIDGAGHVFMTEAQQEEFLTEVSLFLKDVK